MAQGGWRRRGVPLAVTAVIVLILGGGLAFTFQAQGLQAASAWAQLISVGLAAVPLLAWRHPGRRTDQSLPAQVDAAEATLAGLVRRSWRAEIIARQVDNPAPMAVPWRLDVGGEPVETVQSDEIADLADRYLALGVKRLVILGDPGSGKTTLAVLLLRELIARRANGEPVPVMLALADWRLEKGETLNAWLVRQLEESYPALRAAEYGASVATGLVEEGRVCVVLDGLDEMPERWRAKALAAIAESVTREDRIVLTCRSAEYRAAVREGAALGTCAVLEPESAAPDAIVDYLRACLGVHGRQRDAGWPELFAGLAGPDGEVVRSALSSPLNVWLVRKVFVETGDDPRVLLDRGRFPDETAVADHLIARFAERPVIQTGPGSDVSDALSSACLRFLARHMTDSSTRDFAWWRLHEAVGVRLKHRIIAGLGLGLVFTVLTGLAGLLAGALVGAAGAGALGGVVGGAVVGVGLGVGSKTTSHPARVNLRLSGRGRGLLLELLYRGLIGTGLGYITGLAAGLAGGPAWAVPTVTSLGAAYGAIAAVMVWIATVTPADSAPGPRDSLRGDLELAVLRTVALALTGGVTVGLLAGVLGYAVAWVDVFLMLVLIAGLTIGKAPRVAGSIYLISVVILRHRGLVPLRLMGFLDDCHRSGLLRRMGPAYQFRHARLHDHLAVRQDG